MSHTTTDRFRVTDVAQVALRPDAPRVREPTRPPELRDQNFAERFDHHTLVFDAVRSLDRKSVRLICPALLNLSEDIETATFRCVPSGVVCPFRMRILDRHVQIIISVPSDMTALSMECSLGTFEIEVHEDESGVFDNERVLFTLSKNNDLTWLQDWARFYRDVHGATAIVIYDNDSSTYSAEELLTSLREIEGLNAIVVVRWPFRHGPPGHGTKRYWDSNFSQLGALEDARWRFLQKAKSVLNVDVDELVVSKTRASVFDAAEQSVKGVVSFFGDWVFGIENRTRETSDGAGIMRFRDFRYVVKNIREWRHVLVPTYPMRCQPKWAVVPRKCPPDAQWHVHTIRDLWAARLISQNFRFRHFREISTSWKYNRTKREVFDPGRHLEDPQMVEAFSKVNWDS